MAIQSEAIRAKNKATLIAQEIAFAKVLAGNDKRLRDKAVKKLRRWLTARATGSCVLSEDDFMRIWTGLFYCMWMSDKYLVQEELADSLSTLVHCFSKNEDSALLFIKCFSKTIGMEWQGLDQHRLDKFGMLVRRCLRESLEFCKAKSWNLQVCTKLMEVYYSTIFQSSASLGYAFHFLDIYIEEVSSGELETDVLVCLMDPFAKLMVTTRDARVRSQVGRIFRYLMMQTNVGLEYEEKFRAWTKQGCPGRSAEEMELVHDGDELMADGSDDEMVFGNGARDPRAGGVHVTLPQLPVHVPAFTALFNKHLESADATVKGKKMLLTINRQFQQLKKGQFPLAVTKEVIPMKPKKFTLKNAKKLMSFNQKLMKGNSKKGKKLIAMCEEDEEMVNGKSDGEKGKKQEPKKEVVREKKQKKKKKKGRKEVACEERNGTDEEEEVVVHKEEKTNSFIVEAVTEKASLKNKRRKRKTSESWQVDDVTATVESSEISVPKIIKLEKKVEESIFDTVEDIAINAGVSDPWKEPLKEGETEIFVPSKKYLAKSPVGTSPGTPVFWAKAQAKAMGKVKSSNLLLPNPYSNDDQSATTPGRRISFALNRNMAQANEEYLEEVKNSPKLPFDSAKKPKQSSLKPGLSPTPINPFYNPRNKRF